ncbi:PAS domain-containing protein [Rhizobium sp. PP-CC-3G-465]|uniref:blue-light-activated histidine kinase n=1 Tax=Rhizobium sp. PP-CC-3G-465 TaxID=2135648 RepID=UPI00104669C6
MVAAVTEPKLIHGDEPAAASRIGLIDHKELSATAFERTRMPMVISDARQPDYPIVLANESFLKLTGYAADEVVGRNCRFLQGKGTLPASIAEIRAAVAEERECTVEILNYRKDGSAFWNELHISPIYDDDGMLAYYFASQIDMTRFRNIQSLEESEHRLLMEVDHRAKNVLAVVESVVRLTRSDDAARYAASVQNRVQALSRAHVLLADRGWQDVALRDAISVQLDPVVGQRVHLEGPSISVPATIVQPLGLVFHELAVNAAVHGALSKPGGRLVITWSDSTEGGVDLIWRESGGAGSAGTTPGFGSVVLGALVEKQLGGTVDREWTDDGLVLSISFPKALGRL